MGRKEGNGSPELPRWRSPGSAGVDSRAGIPFAEEAVKLQPKYPFGHYLLELLYFDTGETVR